MSGWMGGGSLRCIKLHALLAELLAGLLDLPDELVVGLVAVPQGEQVPPDVDEGTRAKEDNRIEGQGDDQEEPGVVRVGLEFLARAVTEEEGSEGSEPGHEDEHGVLHDLIEASHLFNSLFLYNSLLIPRQNTHMR